MVYIIVAITLVVVSMGLTVLSIYFGLKSEAARREAIYYANTPEARKRRLKDMGITDYGQPPLRRCYQSWARSRLAAKAMTHYRKCR